MTQEVNDKAWSSTLGTARLGMRKTAGGDIADEEAADDDDDELVTDIEPGVKAEAKLASVEPSKTKRAVTEVMQITAAKECSTRGGT